MRFLLILAALSLATAQPAASSACPASAFVINFESNSTALTSQARETLSAAHNRSLMCPELVFTIFTNGDDPVGVERARRIRSELIALGVSTAAPINIAIDEPAGAPRDRVMLMLDYDR